MAINRRRFCAALGGIALAESTSTLFAADAATLHESTSKAFGTTVRLLTRHNSGRLAVAAMQAAFAEITLIESLMSIYQPTSQLSQLNREMRLEHPHPLLVEILETACCISRQTEGAFDITVQPLWSLHRKSSQQGRVPTTHQLNDARNRVDYRNVVIQNQRILLKNGAQITLNGIAQGFATDRTKRILSDHGIQDALIDVGELAGLGEKEQGGESWKAGIQHPRHEDAFLSITPLGNRCLATSGDYATTFTQDYYLHHIFDPNTGRSPTQLASVSVLAPTATEADALSTAMLVLGPQRSAKLLAGRKNVDAMFVGKDGRVSVTRRFPGEQG